MPPDRIVRGLWVWLVPAEPVDDLAEEAGAGEVRNGLDASICALDHLDIFMCHDELPFCQTP